MQHQGSASRRLRRVLVATVIPCALVFAACGGDDDSSSSSSSGSDSTAASSEPVVFANIQGTAAEGGPDFTKGIKIAADEINANGGVEGRKIEVKAFDKGSTVEQAVAAYRDAASDSNVLTAYVGGVVGVDGIAAQTARERVPILQQAGNAKYVDPPRPYVYSMSFDKEYPTSALRWAVEQKGAKKIAILHFDTDYSTGITKSITDRCKELGCSVTTSQEGKTDASVDQLIPLLTRMRSSGADTYYLETINPNVPKAARQLGMFDKTVISEQWLSVPAIAAAVGKDGEDIVFAAQKCVAPELAAEGDEGAAFCTKYHQLYEAAFPGETYALFSIYGYDAVYDFAQAARSLIKSDREVTAENMNTAYEQLDGSLRTSHGQIETSPEKHNLVGTFDQAYLLYEIKADGKNVTYELAPGADPKGAQP